MAKIEKPSAVKNIDSIVEASDGLITSNQKVVIIDDLLSVGRECRPASHEHKTGEGRGASELSQSCCCAPADGGD